jgi:glycosyltransferase involved in cell wall biosynthesis
LLSLKRQTYSNLEVIIVDNYSKDCTKEVAKKYGSTVILFSGPRAKARNVGANVATGNLILSLDSDMQLTMYVIEQCVAQIQADKDAVIIPEQSIGSGFWARCKALEKACYIGDELIEAARFITKASFNDIGGYEAEFVFGEDWDLHQKLKLSGFSIGRIDAPILHHEGNLSLRGTVLKKFQYGQTLYLYRAKHPEKIKEQLTVIRPAFVRNWRKLIKDPIHASGMIVMKVCEFIAMQIGAKM